MNTNPQKTSSKVLTTSNLRYIRTAYKLKTTKEKQSCDQKYITMAKLSLANLKSNTTKIQESGVPCSSKDVSTARIERSVITRIQVDSDYPCYQYTQDTTNHDDMRSLAVSSSKKLIMIPKTPEMKRNNRVQLTEEVSKIKTLDEAMNGENEVKHLDFWEKQTLTNKKTIRAQDNGKLKSNTGAETLNWEEKLKESLVKLNLKNPSNFMKEFYKKSEKDQGSILFQNINLTKKEFNFDLFKNNHSNKSKEDQILDKKTKLDSEAVSLYNNIKREKDYGDVINMGYYRGIIKEKIRIESQSREEMMKLAQRVLIKKKEKENVKEACCEILANISQIREEQKVNIYLSRINLKK